MAKKVYGTDIMPCIFAREEFEKYGKLVFTDWEDQKDNLDIYIGISENGETVISDTDDEIFIDVNGTTGKIVGSNGGAVLIAVYRFFRECGCRFLRPGKDGEYIAKCSLKNAKVCLKEKATSELRTIFIEGSCKFENAYDVIDYSPKVGLNCYHFQFKNSGVFFERWYNHVGNPIKEPEGVSNDRINAEVALLKAEVKKRGMRLSTMGHGWTTYPLGIEANGWEKEDIELPEETKSLLALVNGKRDLIDGVSFGTQLCYSNPIAQDKIADYMVKYCKENPSVDIIEFALADNVNVSCECENCRDHRLSDFVIQIINRMDERMTEEGLKQKILLSAYVDLLWAPLEEKVNNPDRVIFRICPISHVYHEPLPTENIPDEEHSPYVLNKLQFTEDCTEVLSYLKSWQKAAPHKWMIGEYHYMWDHYLDIGYQQIARVVHEDIKNQDKLGLSGMGMYQPQRCSFPTAIGFYTYGNTLWNKNLSFEAISEDYFSHAFGEGWEDVYKYLQGLSDRYDMKIKHGGRDYTALDCIPVLEDCIKMVQDFAKSHKNKKEFASELERISWSDLALHNQYVERYLSAILLGLKGDEEEGKRQIEELVLWMWEIEDEVQPRWDILVHSKHLPIWYDRLMRRKQMEENNEELGAFTMGGGAEGVQA